MADDPAPERRPTISTSQAAAIVGRSTETVRRWFDAMEAAGTPVGERERGGDGRGRGQTWRRPYRDSVERWHQQMQGQVPDASETCPCIDETGPAGGGRRGAVA